jgi:hypothetical protein
MSKARIHNKHHKKTHAVKSQWETNRGRPTYQTGIVVAISQQGNAIYAIVRKQGKQVFDVDHNKVFVDTGLFGNIYNVPEDELAMAECLLPTNLDATRLIMNYQALVGAKVKVQMEQDYPRMVYFENNNNYQARTVNREDLYRARASGDYLSLKDRDALDFFRAIGIDEIVAKFISEEKIKEGQICYGNYSVPDMVSQEDKGTRVMSIIQPTLVVGLQKTELKEKSCHRFPKALGGI